MPSTTPDSPAGSNPPRSNARVAAWTAKSRQSTSASSVCHRANGEDQVRPRGMWASENFTDVTLQLPVFPSRFVQTFLTRLLGWTRPGSGHPEDVDPDLARKPGCGGHEHAPLEPAERRVVGLEPRRGAEVEKVGIDGLAAHEPFDLLWRSVAVSR